MAFNYDVGYKNENIVALFGQVAPNWKTPAKSVAGLDTVKLHATLKKILDEWRKKGSTEAVDKDLQALLAVLVATPWFDKKQSEELEGWLDEVASAVEEDWMKNFKDSEALKSVIMKTIKPQSIEEVNLDMDGKVLTVEYKGGDVGRGKHDGNLHLSDDLGLRLYNQSKSSDDEPPYLVSTEELPNNLEELEKCLKSKWWDEGWDNDDENEGEDGWNDGWQSGWSGSYGRGW